MIEVLVWLLIASGSGMTSDTTPAVVEKFKTREQCQHVMKNMDPSGYMNAKCIQANIYIKD